VLIAVEWASIPVLMARILIVMARILIVMARTLIVMAGMWNELRFLAGGMRIAVSYASRTFPQLLADS
jgi:hypothetical protein